MILLPLQPQNGSYAEARALGHGASAALARCLSSIDVAELEDPQIEDPLAYVLRLGRSNMVDTSTFIGGTFEPAGVVVRSLQRADGSSIDVDLWTTAFSAELDKVATWLSTSTVDVPARPSDAAEFAAEAHAAGALWLAGEVKSVIDEEFQETLAAAKTALESRYGSAYVERRARETAIALTQVMIGKRRPEALDLVTDLLGEVAVHLPPAGAESLVAIVDAGVDQGIDRDAFRAARGYVLLLLGRPDAALADFARVRDAHPLAGAFGVGRVHLAKQDWRAAQQAFDEALQYADPGRPFSDIVRGSDAESEPDAGTWRGLLLAGRGLAELRLGQFPDSVATLEAALDADADRWTTLGYLAHAYRNWAIDGEVSDDEARSMLEKHVDALERRYELHPDADDVRAALDVARLHGDERLARRWNARRE